MRESCVHATEGDWDCEMASMSLRMGHRRGGGTEGKTVMESMFVWPLRLRDPCGSCRFGDHLSVLFRKLGAQTPFLLVLLEAPPAGETAAFFLLPSSLLPASSSINRIPAGACWEGSLFCRFPTLRAQKGVRKGVPGAEGQWQELHHYLRHCSRQEDTPRTATGL